MRRILVADPTADLAPWVEAIVQVLSASATIVHSGDQLESTLLEQGPFDLVLTSAQLSGRSGLQVLARIRSLQERVPFIVVMSVHGPLIRVMISDATAQTLSGRTLDRQNLAALARVLVKESYRPAESC